MKIIGIALFLFAIFPSLNFTNECEKYPTIYVSIVSHNEAPTSFDDENYFWRYREEVLKLSNMLYEEGVKFNFQSDWDFLLAEIKYDKGNSSTNGKNLLRYLKEDLGFEIDPHSHEKGGYNYADVAYLIHSLGVEPSNIAGGLVAYPPEESKIEYFRKTLNGLKFNYSWKAEILWGGSTSGHLNEESLWISGIWRPKDNENFLTHDENFIPHIGGYQPTWDGLHRLLQKQQNGELEENKIYTQSIVITQGFINEENFIENFRQEIRNLSEYEDKGLIKWVGLGEVINIWYREYNAQPNIYPYVYMEMEIKKPAENFLYIFNREIMKIEKTIIIGYINVEAEVICDIDIDEVYFYLNGILMEKDSTPPFEWNWIKPSLGKYILKVVAKAGALSKEKEIETIAVII